MLFVSSYLPVGGTVAAAHAAPSAEPATISILEGNLVPILLGVEVSIYFNKFRI